jgi:hypothetical protein
MKDVVKARMVAFGQAGQAPKIRQTTLDEMSRRYFT